MRLNGGGFRGRRGDMRSLVDREENNVTIHGSTHDIGRRFSYQEMKGMMLLGLNVLVG